MEIDTKIIKELREKTSAGIMDCKKALEESGGDVAQAESLLRSKGIASAAKKAERDTDQGVIATYIHSGGRFGYKEPHTLDIMDLSNIIKALKSNNNINHLQISLSKNNDSLVKQISELADTYKSVDTKILSRGAFQEFIKNYFVQDHVNLLQGDFKPKIKFEKVFKPWRTSLALSTFLLLSLLINNVLNMNKLVNYEADLSAYFLNEYKYFYNNARNVDDPIRIVNSIKNGAQLNMNNSIFLNGLNIISESVAKENNVQLSSISFTDNRFNLRLLTSTLTSLDSLITNINTNGSLNAIIQTTNQSDNKVESRIEIQVNL